MSSDIMCNIYDLEGNNLEWTAQWNRIHRGYYGSYFNNSKDPSVNGTYYPATSDGNMDPYFDSCYMTSRAVLYIKY